MTFLELPTELHTSLLLEWIPFYTEYSALDVALSERRYWLELLRSPVLVVDPPLAIAPDRSYYTWLESRQLKVATLCVDMAVMPSIKTMRFPSVTKVVAVFSEEIKEIQSLAHFLEANDKVSHVRTKSPTLLLEQDDLMALAKHPLDLRVLDLRGTAIHTCGDMIARGIYALLFQFGGHLQELRLRFRHHGGYSEMMQESGADVMLAIAQRCPQLCRLELADCNIPMKAIILLCEKSRSIIELRLCAGFQSYGEIASACQEVLNRLPRLQQLSLTSDSMRNIRLPSLGAYPCLRSIRTDEGSVDLIQGTVELKDWVLRSRAHEILLTLPRAMQSISCASCQAFNGREVLEIVEKHGSQLEVMAFGLTMAEDEWEQLWTMCPKLKTIKTSNMTLDTTARCFELKSNASTLERYTAINLLLTVPVSLMTIQLHDEPTLLTAFEDLIDVAAKHGDTLRRYDIRLDVDDLGYALLRSFFVLCPELQGVVLAQADADSLYMLTKRCKRVTDLCIDHSRQKLTDNAVFAVLERLPLTSLSLINCDSITPAVFDHIGRLTQLSLADNSSISINDIVDALAAGKFSNLTTLRLGCNSVQMHFIETVMQLTSKSEPDIVALSQHANCTHSPPGPASDSSSESD